MFGNNKSTEAEISERAERIASEANDTLREMRREARHQADEVRREAIKLLNNAAERIRREVRDMRAGSEVRENTDKIASGLERAANFLRRNPVENLTEDLQESSAAHPWRNLAIAFVIGLFIGMIVRGGGDPSKR